MNYYGTDAVEGEELPERESTERILRLVEARQAMDERLRKASIANGKQAYRLYLPPAYKIHNISPVSRMELYNQRQRDAPA
jgi:hypothetical protein